MYKLFLCLTIGESGSDLYSIIRGSSWNPILEFLEFVGVGEFINSAFAFFNFSAIVGVGARIGDTGGGATSFTVQNTDNNKDLSKFKTPKIDEYFELNLIRA